MVSQVASTLDGNVDKTKVRIEQRVRRKVVKITIRADHLMLTSNEQLTMASDWGLVEHWQASGPPRPSSPSWVPENWHWLDKVG